MNEAADVTVEQVAAALELYERAVLVVVMRQEMGLWTHTPTTHVEALAAALHRMQAAWGW